MSDSSPEKLTGQIYSQILTELKERGDFEHLPLPLLFCSWCSPCQVNDYHPPSGKKAEESLGEFSAGSW